jgi:hypothetical protein
MRPVPQIVVIYVLVTLHLPISQNLSQHLRNVAPVVFRGFGKKKYVTATRHIFIPFSSRFISYIIKTSLASCFLDGTCAGIEQGSRYCTFVSRNLMYLKKLEKSGEVTFPETCSSFHVTFFPCPDSRLVLLCYNKREQVHF